MRELIGFYKNGKKHDNDFVRNVPEPLSMVADWSGTVGCASGGIYAADWAPQGRILAALRAADTLADAKNLLRSMPRHLCTKINPAIQQISSSCARPYFGRL